MYNRQKIAIVVGFTEKNSLHNAVYTAIKKQILFFQDDMEIYFVTDNKLYYNRLKEDFALYTVIFLEKKSKISKIVSEYGIDTFWVPDVFTTIYLRTLLLFKGVKIITWYQGLLPEESYLKNRSKLRYWILSIIEYLGLLFSNRKIFVSTTMKKHYEDKYRLKFDDFKYIEIPCYSDLIFHEEVVKISNSFVYVGGMAVWQCFDNILSLFKDRYEKLPGSKLYVVTLDREIALEKLRKFDINHYEILSINNREELAEFLNRMEYGFLIRENIAVNNVASPIKFAEYLSCGVNIIMNSSVAHFSEILIKYKIGNVVDLNNTVGQELLKVNPNEIVKIYNLYFDEAKGRISYKNLIK